MKKILILILTGLLAACTPMDNKYKDFIKDGPIVYLSKLDEKSVVVIGERERVNFQWSALSDPRGKKAIIYWANKSEKFETVFNPATPTSIFVAPLKEGSYIFEIFITDNEGNSSIPISTSGYSYGRLYESYLINRKITGSALTDNGRTVTCPEVADKTMTGMDFEWADADKTPYSGFIAASELTGTLEDCQSLSFRFRAKYSPEGGVDLFYAPWEYYVENVKSKDIIFNYETKAVSFPSPNDGNWVGYQMSWIDKTTGEAHSFTITGNEAIISHYNAREFVYVSVYNFDGQQLISAENNFLTAQYVDLDRTNWYAAPETDLDDNPLPNVNFGTAPPAITAGPNAVSTINNKKKSPYLSHFLPWNSSALSATGGDGVNSPTAHFDNNSMTYLSMVKGIGTDATFTGATNPPASNWFHLNNGVIITQANEKPWFIIRLDETQPQKFNYFRMRFRENGSNGSGLKPQGVTFFGSNDDSCITDDKKWTKINADVIVPPGSTAASTQPPAANMGTFEPGANLETGNVMLPKICEYRYIKVQYDKWELGSNALQIAEFWLGLYD